MTPNLGSIDRLIRFFLGVILISAPFANLPPIWSSTITVGLSVAIGAILVATSFFQFCPLYRVLGISTCKL